MKASNRNKQVKTTASVFFSKLFDRKGQFISFFIFDVLIFILVYLIWPRILVDNFLIYKYAVSVDYLKIVICFAVSLVMVAFESFKYSFTNSFSDKVVYLLTVLYFIPGLAVCSAISAEWIYILSYCFYYFAMILFHSIIPKPKRGLSILSSKTCLILLCVLIVFCFTYPFIMMVLYGKSFSLESFFEALRNPYAVRSESKNTGVRYAFLLFEYWGVYFGAVLIVYSMKKKWFLVTTFTLIVEMYYYTLQGNRIILFLALLALLLGFLRIKEKYFGLLFLLLALIQIAEFMIMSNNNSIGLVTDAFRRYSAVPNIISVKYFDFFQTEQPDYLRGLFPHVYSLFNSESPYGSDIGYLIGKEYFGLETNANNGLVGGAFFEFGFVGVVLDPLFLILSLRAFDKVSINLGKKSVLILAITYASLAINNWAIWSQLIRPSYILLLLVSVYLLSGAKKVNNKQEKLVGMIAPVNQRFMRN